jgi:hypothetical protein
MIRPKNRLPPDNLHLARWLLFLLAEREGGNEYEKLKKQNRRGAPRIFFAVWRRPHVERKRAGTVTLLAK